MGKADIHIHTCYSDGINTPREILDWVEEKTDLNLIAITDHDTIKGALEAQKIFQKNKYHFELILGEEISTCQGDILALFIKEEIPPHLSLKETILRIKKQKGLVIVPHPFYFNPLNFFKKIKKGDGIKSSIFLHQFDGIEIVSGFPNWPWDDLLAFRVFKKISCAAIGSTDAHIKEIIGRAYTLFPGKTAQDFKKAILEKKTFAFKKYNIAQGILWYFKYFLLPRFKLK